MNSFQKRFKITNIAERNLDLSFISSFVSRTNSDLLLLQHLMMRLKVPFLISTPIRPPALMDTGINIIKHIDLSLKKISLLPFKSFFHYMANFDHRSTTLSSPSSPKESFRRLQNIIYKGISKIIVNRLRPILQRDIYNSFTKRFYPRQIYP